jgi:hypothetical protein
MFGHELAPSPLVVLFWKELQNVGDVKEQIGVPIPILAVLTHSILLWLCHPVNGQPIMELAPQRNIPKDVQYFRCEDYR